MNQRTQIDFDFALSYGQNRANVVLAFEREYVQALLERHSGNVTAASREGGIDRKHLHDLVVKHCVDVNALRGKV